MSKFSDGSFRQSVYTMWNNPGIIPLLHTPDVVVDKIQGGADLMTPGLARPPFPENAKKGAIVAVASVDYPSVPVAVGTCAIDVSSLTETRGAKGHAVEIFHWFGDDLWKWSTSGKGGGGAPTEIAGWLDEDKDEDEKLAKAAQDLDLDDDDEDGGVSLNPPPDSETAPKTTYNEHVSGEDIPANSETVPIEEMSTKGDPFTQISLAAKALTFIPEIDDAFKQALIYGIYQQKKNNPSVPKNGLTFPLSQSYIMSSLVIPFLPTFTPEQTQSLNIKKTSWKNARKFIKALDKEKLVLCKDQKKESVVLDIDFDDQKIVDFTPYPLPRKESPSSDAKKPTDDPTSGNSSHDESMGQRLKVLTTYKPKEALLPLFPNTSQAKSKYHTAAEIRQTITSYVESEKLVKSSNKRFVTLDPIISHAILEPDTSRPDAEIAARGLIARDVLVDRVIAGCSTFHAISREDDSAPPKFRPGAPPKLTVHLETRSGNKTATRVYNLESFFVSAQALADELRKACASSTSVEPYRAGGKGMSEVMVQGPQRDAVIKAVERRGVQKGWVEVLDKTKKKKK